MATTIKVTDRKLSSLEPYDKNSRSHTAGQIKSIADSIQEFGWTNPLIIHGNTVVAGHARLAAAQLLRLDVVPVIDRSDMSEVQWKAYVIADNKLAENATWDDAVLRLELGDLDDMGFDLNLTGFSDLDLDALMGPSDGLVQPDLLPPPAIAPRTKTGGVWQLGKHRVLCGDASDAADVALLMGSEKAELVFTDPPYGVGYTGGTKKRKAIPGDQDDQLYAVACDVAFKYSVVDAPLYLCHAGSHTLAAAGAVQDAGYQIRSQIIWNKNQAQFGSLSAHYKQKHEPIFYAVKKGKSARWVGAKNETSVWDIPRAPANDLHPTQKPVALGDKIFGNHDAGLILDPFLGSGSSLIAAERMGRTLYGMELEPEHCDTIVDRWEAFTGREAVYDGEPSARS